MLFGLHPRFFRRDLSRCASPLHGWVSLVVAGLGLLWAFQPFATRAAEVAPISSIAVVRALAPEEAARGLPVRVTVVVTRCTLNEVYIQEGSEAVFMAPDPLRAVYRPGDLIEVIGVTGKGHFLPTVMETSSRLIEHRGLPAPIRATYGDLASGRLDCCLVEITGAIRSAERTSPGKVACRLAMGEDVFRVEITDSAAHVPSRLIGAVVRLRGVAGGLKNSQRQIIQPIIWVTTEEETFVV